MEAVGGIRGMTAVTSPSGLRPLALLVGFLLRSRAVSPKLACKVLYVLPLLKKGCPFFESPDWGCRRDWGYVGQIDIESDGVRPLERGLLGSSFGFYVSMQEGSLNDLTFRWYTMCPIKIPTAE